MQIYSIMKKLLLSLVLTLGMLVTANAQIGIIGGWTTAKAPVSASEVLESAKNASLFHAGLAYKFELGPVFTLQPALVYQGKAASVNVAATEDASAQSLYSRSNFLELEVGAQVGIDLLALRPYLLFEPFIGYDLSAFNTLADDVNSGVSTVLNNAKNKLEYGFGVGAGIELVNHVQLSVQWFMNLGKLYNGEKLTVGEQDYSQFTNLKNYQGVKLTLGLFF